MIDRKLWNGGMLNLSAGTSFFGRDSVVSHSAGTCIVSNDSEVGDPLVEIDGGLYIVKRSDLYELDDRQCEIAHLTATLMYAGLNQTPKADIDAAISRLKELEATDV